MGIWSKISELLHPVPKMQKDETQSHTDEVDYGERVTPPNGIFGKAAGGRSVNPRDSSNPANPFSASKRDRW